MGIGLSKASANWRKDYFYIRFRSNKDPSSLPARGNVKNDRCVSRHLRIVTRSSSVSMRASYVPILLDVRASYEKESERSSDEEA